MDREALIQGWMERQKENFAGFVRAVRGRFGEISAGQSPQGKESSLDPQLRRWCAGHDNLDGRGDADELKQSIADVLEVPKERLFPAPTRSDPSLFPIAEFELIGPFDPKYEAPCFESALRQSDGPRALFAGRDDAEINWFRPEEASAKWVHAPAGTGRSFVAHWHQHRWKTHLWNRDDPGRFPPAVFVVQGLDDLREIAWPPSTQPMIVDLATASGDLQVLRALARHGAMVIAPFPCPVVEDPGELASLYAWREFEWAPGVAWRRAFIGWVGERVARRDVETLLDTSAVSNWLDAVDSHVRIFNTPETLLGILRFAHEHGEKRLQGRFGADLARDWLAAGFEGYGGTTVREVWLREAAPRAIEMMIAAWWSDPRLAWNDRIRVEDWETLVPADATGSADEAREEALRVAAQLRRKVTKPKRRELEKEHDRWLARPPGRGDVVRALAAARILRGRETGMLQLAPSWIPAAFVFTQLGREINRGSVSSWGRAAIDPSRQADVDAALDRLSWESLSKVIARVLDTFEVRSLPLVGAIEALFLAVGRKLRRGYAVPAACEEALDRLLAHQLPLLVIRVTSGLPAPRTRGGPHEPQQAGAHFLAACWDWSFARPRPVGFDALIHPWEFPGWSTPDLEALPAALRFHEGKGLRGPLAEIEWDGARRLAELSLRALKRCSGDFPHGELNGPSYLTVAAVALAHERRASLLAVLKKVRDGELPHDLAARWISETPEEERAAMLDAIWEALLGEGKTVEKLVLALAPAHRASRMREALTGRPSVPLSALDEMLRDRSPIEALCERAAADGGWNEERVALLVARAPDAFRMQLLQPLVDLARRPGAPRDLVDGLAVVGLARPEEMIDLLMVIAEDKRAAHRVVGTLWRIAPELIGSRAAEAWREHGATNPWIDWMPPENLGPALAVFESAPERSLSLGVRNWLARQLPAAGPLAERVWALLERDHKMREESVEPS